VLPERFRYFALDLPIADGFRTRLWLVDLSARRAPTAVAEWDAPASPVGGYSISADGKTAIVSAAGTRSRVALYLLRPQDAEVRVLFEEPGAIVVSSRISPDGQRFAFTKYPADGGSDLGMWTGATSGGAPRRIVDGSTSSSVPIMALSWSADSTWLAFTRELERTEIRLVSGDGGPEIAVGPGNKMSWRAKAPELLVADPDTRASRAYSFDLATRKAVDLFTVDKLFIPLVQWHPSLERFVYVEAESASREASGGIWIRNADGTGGTRLDTGRSVSAPQWSSDGTMLTVLGGGDDAVVPVVELFSGRRITVLCRRGGTPPGDCV